MENIDIKFMDSVMTHTMIYMDNGDPHGIGKLSK